MTLLNKQKIAELVDPANPQRIIEAAAPAKYVVQGATLDVTIGDIFLPGSKDDELGGKKKPRRTLQLESGNTAIVRTAETIRLPKNIAAIGFPPSTNVSLGGLLTTNPGHVDPGFNGQLHLTVINMGRDPFFLARGERIMRLMLFELAADAPVNTGPVPSPIDEQLLGKLSSDFLNIKSRISKAANWVTVVSAWLPAVAAIVAAIISAAGAVYLSTQDLKDQIAKLDAKVGAIGSKVDLSSITGRIDALEKRGNPSPAATLSAPSTSGP